MKTEQVRMTMEKPIMLEIEFFSNFTLLCISTKKILRKIPKKFPRKIPRERRMEVNPTILKAAVCLVALCLAGFLLGPPLYWHFTEGLAVATHSSASSSGCPRCLCDCSSQPLSNPYDCAKHAREASEDTKSNIKELREELMLQEAEALKNQQHADNALLEAKKMTSRYQKEADKCNSGMETCEEGRETAEAALAAQKKLTAMWKLRARQKGWTAKVTKSHNQSQKNVTNA